MRAKQTVAQFHVDFVNPENSTFGVFDTPPAAPFTMACPDTRACVPELGVQSFDWLEVTS